MNSRTAAFKYSVDFSSLNFIGEAISAFILRAKFIIFHIPWYRMQLSKFRLLTLRFYSILIIYPRYPTALHGSYSLWSPLGILMRRSLNYLFIWNVKFKIAFSCLWAPSLSNALSISLSHSFFTSHSAQWDWRIHNDETLHSIIHHGL